MLPLLLGCYQRFQPMTRQNGGGGKATCSADKRPLILMEWICIVVFVLFYFFASN